MDADLNSVWKQFREAVAVLALPPDEQPRVNGPGCLACDLLNDYAYACDAFVSNFGDSLTTPQRDAISEMNALLAKMEPADYECFNDEVVRRPVWQSLREKANEALRVFGCEGKTVKPFVEVQPGVWYRPAPE